MDFSVFLVDAEDGSQVFGAKVDVYDPNGRLIRTISRSDTFGDCDVRRGIGRFTLDVDWDSPIEDHENNEYIGHEFAPGVYRFVETAPPAPPTLDGRSVKAGLGSLLRGAASALRDGDFDISEELERAYEELSYFEYGLAPALEVELAGDGDDVVVIEHRRIRKKRLVDDVAAKIPPRGTLLAYGWLAGTTAVALAVALIAAPALWMTVFGLWSLGQPGMGPLFALGNLVDYLSSFLFSGWRAVSLACAHYAPPAAIWLASLFAATLIGWRLEKGFDALYAERTRPKNKLLDSIPKPAGHNEFGSGRLIDDPNEIERAFETSPEDAEDLQLGGVVVGSIEEPWRKRVPMVAMHGIAMLIWGLKLLRCKVSGGERPPRPQRKPIGRRLVYSTKDMNSTVIADTRAGKTRRCLIPTIDLLSRASEESFVAIDPKGELTGLTSEGAAKTSRVVVFNFRKPRAGDRFNFMQQVIDAVRAEGGPDWSAADRAAADLVEHLLPSSQDVGQSSYFNQGARAYMKSAILWVASWKTVPDDQRNLTTVSRMLGKYCSARPLDPDKPNGRTYVPWEMMLDRLGANHPAREAYDPIANTVDKERMAFITTAQTVLRDFRDSNISYMTSKTDFDPRRIGTEKCAVYIIIPVEKETYGMFANLMIQQLYQVLIEEAADRGGRLPYRVNLLCEEFGQIPPIPNLHKKMNSCLGLGIRWLLILQSMAQLASSYDDTDDKIVIGSCGMIALLKTNDHERTGRWFSEHIGRCTIEIGSSSKSGKRLSIFKENGTQSVSYAERMRLYPEEVSRWRPSYGALVTFTDAADSAYVVPLPDVSELAASARMGLGDPEHNREKTEQVMARLDKGDVDMPQPWYPELKKMSERGRAYTDDEMRAAERKWFAGLRSQFLRESTEAPAKEAKGRGPEKGGADGGTRNAKAPAKRKPRRVAIDGQMQLPDMGSNLM